MNPDNNYLKTRKLAIIFTLIVIVLVSITYFSTDIAEKNNEMMYKEIYGENATLNDIGDNVKDVRDEDVAGVKTLLV